MMGACSPLVRGIWAHISISWPSSHGSSARILESYQLFERELTACMSAPDPVPPFVTAIALPLISAVDFCLFTTIWDDPKELEAARFVADIMTCRYRAVESVG